jgi:dTDP-4-dehydrorhamnose reductase
VRAVTAWSLLGAYDWTSLLTREDGVYECGVFDLRGTPPPDGDGGAAARPGGRAHPDAPGAGLARLVAAARAALVPSRATSPTGGPGDAAPAAAAARPILVAGGSGALARAFAGACEARGLPYRLLPRASLDIADEAAVAEALGELRPWAVINAAGYGAVDRAESEPEAPASGPTPTGPSSWRRPARGSVRGWSASRRGWCSMASGPSRTSSTTWLGPLNVYGRAKVEGELGALERHEGAAMVVRAGSFFGHDGRSGFAARTLRALEPRRGRSGSRDLVVSPTYVPDLVRRPST